MPNRDGTYGAGPAGQPQGIAVYEDMSLPTAAPGEIPPDMGKSQGGNAWRYAMMVNKGFIKPVEKGQRGWKSAEEMQGILCFVSLPVLVWLTIALMTWSRGVISMDTTRRCVRMR